MDELIYTVVRWLGETYPGLHGRPTYRFFGLAMVVIFIGGLISARHYATQRKALKNGTAHILLSHPLVKVSFTEESGQTVKYTATLGGEEGAYIVSVRRECQGSSCDKRSLPLASIDEVESYLTTHTFFLLSDFGKQIG